MHAASREAGRKSFAFTARPSNQGIKPVHSRAFANEKANFLAWLIAIAKIKKLPKVDGNFFIVVEFNSRQKSPTSKI